MSEKETDRTVKIGLVGLGFAGTNLHLPPLLQNPRAELVAVADNDKAKVDDFKKSHKELKVKASIDWKELVADPAVEAVFIATPTPTHLPIAEGALQAGKHVFCEKPVAINIEDAHKMLELSKKHSDRILMIGQVLRFWDDYVQANQMVRHGKIGEPRIARASRTVAMPSGWFAQEELSGGVIMDLSLHDIDFLIWTIGDVESVYAQGADCSGKGGPGFVDYVQTQLNFRSGAIAHVEGVWASAKSYPFTTSLEISGTKGMLSMDNSGFLTSLEITGSNNQPQRMSPAEFNGYYHEDDAFLRAIISGAKDSPIGVDDVIHPLEVVMAAKESIKTGQVVPVARSRETIGAGR